MYSAVIVPVIVFMDWLLLLKISDDEGLLITFFDKVLFGFSIFICEDKFKSSLISFPEIFSDFSIYL